MDGEAAAAQNLDDLQANGSVQLLYLLRKAAGLRAEASARRGKQCRRTRNRRGARWREAALRRLPVAGAPSREADQAESNNVLTSPPGTRFRRPLRTSLCVMSNAGTPARTRCDDLSCTPDSKPPSRYRRREQQPKSVRSTMGSSWPNSRSGPPEPAMAPVNRGADEPAVNARPLGYPRPAARPATIWSPGGLRSVATRSS